MNISEYFSWLFSANSISSYIGIAVTVVILMTVLGGFTAGFRRGLARQVLHTIAMAVAAVASFLISSSFINSTNANGELKKAVIDLLNKNPELANTLNPIVNNLSEETLVSVIIMLLSAIAASVAMVLIYLVLSLIMNVVYFIISRFVPKMRGISGRVPGMVIGLFEGVMVSVLILLPFTTVSELGAGLNAAIEEANIEDEVYTPFYEKELKPHESNPLIQASKVLGANHVINKFATAQKNEVSIDYRTELYNGYLIYSDIASLDGVVWQSLNEQQKTAITHILDLASESEFYAPIVADLLRASALCIVDDSLGITAEPPFDAFFREVIEIFTDCTADTLHGDLDTFSKVYFILSDSGTLLAISESADAVTEALSAKDENGDTVINRVIDVLKQGGERTASIITTLTKLSVTVMAQNLGLDEEAAELYDNVKDGINGVLEINREDYSDPEQFKTEVSNSINTTLTDNGIALDQQVVDTMAEYYVNSDFDQLDELTDEEISDILLTYYDAYADMIPQQ